MDTDPADGGERASDAAEHAESERRIIRFFPNHRPITRADADQTAARITGQAVRPLPLQGLKSYTVAAGETAVIQFRGPECMADVRLWNLARQTYGSGLVPRCEPLGLLGHLHVYRTDLIPGVAFCRVRVRLFEEGKEQILSRTVQDLARFYASAWLRPQPSAQKSAPETNSQQEEYIQILERLRCSLPARFHEKLAEVRKAIDLLFSSDYPQVPNHHGPLDRSLHIDPSTGEITGITNWTHATVSPFGTSLWGVEAVLVSPGPLGAEPSFHPEHQRLRRKFWRVFLDKIREIGISEPQMAALRTARMFGLFRALAMAPEPLEEHSQDIRESGADVDPAKPLLYLDTIISESID